jgi:TPR repeat protein
VTVDPSDPSRIDQLAKVIAARAKADPVLADRLRELLHDAQEPEEIRSSIERDLQYVAEQRLVALAVDLGMARAELEPGPAMPAVSNCPEEAERVEAMQEAERWFRYAAEAGSDLARFNLGILLVQRGELEEAELLFRGVAMTGDTGLASRASEALDRIKGTFAELKEDD